MSFSVRITAIVVIGACSTTVAVAEQPQRTDLARQQAASVTKSHPVYYRSVTQKEEAPSPSDQPQDEAESAAPSVPSKPARQAYDGGCSDCCGGSVSAAGCCASSADCCASSAGCSCGGCGCTSFSCCGCGCEQAEPWTLPQPCLLQKLGIRVGGWLQQGITFNTEDPVQFNGPVATNDFNSAYQMNQLWMFFDRPADTGGCGFAVGGHVDVIYGSDWRFGINNGLEDRINGFDFQKNGLVIPQAYLEVAYNNLSVKLGHFAAILDYEVVPAPPNPFYSHSYSYGYTVPQLVTGALADYKLTDQFSVQAGFHRGWFMFEDRNENLDFIGGVKWQSADKKSSLAYAVSTGPQDPPADWNGIPGDQHRFVYSLVAQHQVTEKLRYVLVHNLGTENNALNGGQDAEFYGLNQYFLYAVTPTCNFNLRVEWLRDDDGTRVAGPGNIPGVYAWNGFGYAGNFYEITAGLYWRPCPNLILRPEVRWDWYSGLAGPRGLPFDDGSSTKQGTFAVDAILTF